MRKETLERFLANPAYKAGGILYTKDHKKVNLFMGAIVVKNTSFKFKHWRIVDDIIDIGNHQLKISDICAIGKTARIYPPGTRLSTNPKPTVHG